MLLFVATLGINFFICTSNEEIPGHLYILWVLTALSMLYHYKSYTYYNEKILNGFAKQFLLLLSLAALGFNFFIVYKTTLSLFGKMMDYYGSIVDLSIDLASFLFGLLGVFEIIYLYNRIQRVEKSTILGAEK
ncbi:hypothetical protein [Kordia jejudonensis]|uniref:hypothetical protein n=1 Tax=Kordia jejudonensis TaxID=1348245 RepID=UPI0006297087|nr:hypothetical protein [Kordia jejudonensis]